MNDFDLLNTPALHDWNPLPTDRVVYKDLPSHVVDWLMLEEDLSNRPKFCGVVEIRTTSGRGRVFYLDSQTVSSQLLTSQGWKPVLGVSRVLELLSQADARLSVFALEASVTRLAVAGASWMILRSMSASIEIFTYLMNELETTAHTGVLELRSDRGTGSIWFEHGSQIMMSFTMPDSPVVFGIDVLQFFQITTRWPDAVLRILGSESEALQHLGIIQTQVMPTESAKKITQEDFSTIQVKTGFPEIIAAWNAVLEFTEQRTDAARGFGTFDIAWREICLELVDRYPQLDPFLEDIRYSKRKLSIAKPTNASCEALCVSYMHVLIKLGVSIAAVRPLLMPLRDKYAQSWRAAQLEAVCPL